MLTIINTLTDQIEKIIENDPVRPNIPKHQRLGKNKDIFTVFDKNNIEAITCVSYTNFIPIHENELFDEKCVPEIAVFYTIWSYKKGAGKKLILESVDYLYKNCTNIKRFVTLSPQNEMARNFHLKNGAFLLNYNSNTVNYEYIV
jgi:hypothetical protein